MQVKVMFIRTMHVADQHAVMFRVSVFPGARKMRHTIIKHDVFEELGVLMCAVRKTWDGKVRC